MTIRRTIELSHVFVEARLVPLLLDGRAVARVFLFFITVSTQVPIGSHPLGVQLLELLVNLLHLLLKLHINETFNTNLIRLSDELDRLSEVGPLLATLTGFLDDGSVNTSLANASRSRRIEGLFADFFGLLQPLLQLNLLLPELLLHGLALTLLCLLLFGHVLLQRLVLLCQLHILLHGLVEQLEFAVKVR